MKKALLALFSVSITAGLCALTYSQLKDLFIKKLVGIWLAEGKKKELTLDEKLLKAELDKLYLWQVKQLLVYQTKVTKGGSEKEINALAQKIKDKKILELGDFKSVDTLLFAPKT